MPAESQDVPRIADGVPVVYDSGALIAAAKGSRAIKAIHRRSLERGVAPIVPAAVLAEVYAVGGRLDYFLAGCDAETLEVDAAKRTGRIRAAAGRGSVVDAVCIETALRYGAACVTSDAEDLRALSAVTARTVTLIEI